MIDPFGRHITYLRVSVTDRCDFRCVYCMAEDMTFLPKAELLSLEELDRLCCGLRPARRQEAPPDRRRAAGAARRHDPVPRARRATSTAARSSELTLTTNGSQLAATPRSCGDRRAPGQRLARHARPRQVPRASRAGASSTRCCDGIDAAKHAGLTIKINAVALKGVNDDGIRRADRLVRRPRLRPDADRGHADGRDRRRRALDQYLPLSLVRGRARQRAGRSTETDYRTGGPARYFTVAETGGRLGFITPLTHNFCESCNRVRLTCTGTLYMCLGQDDAADLRAPLRASRRATSCSTRDPRGDRAQAQGPRFHHRPPPQRPGRAAPHERHRRLKSPAPLRVDRPGNRRS